MEELELKVIDWARQRGLLKNVSKARIEAQSLKVLEEIGETARAILKLDKNQLTDGIGDVYVTLIILAKMKKEDIRKRQGNYQDVSLQRIVMAYDSNVNWAIDMLYMIADKFGLKAIDCLQVAYDEISNRKGIIVNNTFVKD